MIYAAELVGIEERQRSLVSVSNMFYFPNNAEFAFCDFSWSLQNISKQKKSEQKLANSEEGVMDASKCGVQNGNSQSSFN